MPTSVAGMTWDLKMKIGKVAATKIDKKISAPINSSSAVMKKSIMSRQVDNEISDADDDDPQFPGISPLQIGDIVLCMDPSFYFQDPRFPGLISSQIVFIPFVEYFRAKKLYIRVRMLENIRL